jgi:hypothetical protein
MSVNPCSTDAVRVYVELPPGWGPAQRIATAWKRAGYTVVIERGIGTGEATMRVYGGLELGPAE